MHLDLKKEMIYNINPKIYNDEILVTLINHVVILDKAAFFVNLKFWVKCIMLTE